MARKTVALLGKSLLGKVRSPATGAEGLPSRCLPLVMSKALSLLQQRVPLGSQRQAWSLPTRDRHVLNQ